ncbi:TIGR00730 family Rossman fold protein [Paenibacillus sp. YIM B09110]|uniref:LOG family protein n=1 Tax=Paenibacillus sp. YIM B09110 TaxID=3126102 RepID=UPI00301D3108
MKRITVYSGSNPGNHVDYENSAIALGKALAAQNIELVYGGGKLGLMGRIAGSVLESGGKVIGVMPRGLFSGEVMYTELTEFYEVANMHERKAKMSDLGDAYISMPGGLGTFEELFEMACWAQIGIHKKPIGLLNVRGFYNPLIDLLKHAVKEGFMRESNLDLFIVESDPDVLLERIANYKPSEQSFKWSEISPAQSAVESV